MGAMFSLRRRLVFSAFAFGVTGCATTTPISDGSGGAAASTSVADGPTTGAGGEGGASTCGDDVCASFETCVSCPIDCGDCGPACGDGTCDATEDCTSCPDDCGACGVCGDGTCSPDETCMSCYEDCGVCACMPDSLEPNDSSPSATVVSSGVDICNLSICSGDTDWLEFSVAHGFTAKATFKAGQGDLDLEIYSAQTFNFITGSYSSDDDESVTLSGLTTGSYWARVYGKAGAVNPEYCFRVDTN
jgi:hypothetical protein